MNNAKSPKNVSLKNQLELWLFCTLIGAVAGALVWILLKIMAVGTEFLWKWLPGKTSVPYYTILICAAGAAIIGIFRKIFGDYPEDLETVMEKVRTEKRYEYKNMLHAIFVADIGAGQITIAFLKAKDITVGFLLLFQFADLLTDKLKARQNIDRTQSIMLCDLLCHVHRYNGFDHNRICGHFMVLLTLAANIIQSS